MKNVLFVLLIGVPCFAGCASSERAGSQPAVTTVSMHIAYPQDSEHVQRAYRLAVSDMNLHIADESEGKIEAVAASGRAPTRVRIELAPSDTLTTDVLVTSDYVGRSGVLTHYPYELSYRASKHIDTRTGYAHVYPQLIYPEDIRECRAPQVENWSEVEMPVLIGGLEGVGKGLTYTSAALEAQTEGRVYVEAVVNEKGGVSCAVINAGLPHGLNVNALAAVARAQFEPALLNGTPVPVKLVLPLTFRIRR